MSNAEPTGSDGRVSTTGNDESSTAVDAAPAGAGSYHFQKFVLSLPDCREEDLFKVQGDQLEMRDEHGRARGLFAHEFTHYVQALSTTVGHSIVINWLGLVVQIARELRHQEPLLVPISGTNRGSSAAVVRLWNTYWEQAREIVGARSELRPAGELVGKAPWEIFSFQRASGTEASALAVPGESALIGVPLLGNVFIEGYAQAVQWLVDGSDRSLEERLAERLVEPRSPTKAKSIYYTAIARFIGATLPGWDIARTTIILCDAALCSRRPWQAFENALEIVKSEKRPTCHRSFANLRGLIAQTTDELESSAFIEKELIALETQLADAPEESAAGFIRCLIGLMKGGRIARIREPDYFLDDEYGQAWRERVVAAIGSPPLILKDIEHVRSLCSDDQVLRACFWVRGTYDLISVMIHEGFVSPCPLLPTKICAWKKTDSCRKGHLLNAPVHDGRGCYMAKTAQSMGMLGREWKQRG